MSGAQTLLPVLAGTVDATQAGALEKTGPRNVQWTRSVDENCGMPRPVPYTQYVPPLLTMVEGSRADISVSRANDGERAVSTRSAAGSDRANSFIRFGEVERIVFFMAFFSACVIPPAPRRAMPPL